MKESITNMKDNNRIGWRRNKVNELSIKGFTQADIARMLQISEPTISRDIEYLRQQANETIRNPNSARPKNIKKEIKKTKQTNKQMKKKEH